MGNTPLVSHNNTDATRSIRLQASRWLAGLAGLGFVLLWGGMLVDGTVLALLQAAWTGVFADGRPLRTRYTGVWPVDFAVAVVVAFFNEQTDGRDQGAWLFMLDFQVQLQTTALWFLIETSRAGTNLWLSFLPWPLLTNLFGAAVALPLFLWAYVPTVLTARSAGVLSTARERSLLPVLILTAFGPLLLMMYAYRFAGDATRQALIAAQLFSPILMTAAVAAVPSPPGHNVRVPTAYMLSGLASAAVHVYTLAVTLTSSDPDLKWARLFVPAPSHVVAGSLEIVHDGGLLFLQYDWLVVSATCGLWAYFLTDTDGLAKVQERIGRVLMITAGLVFLGPAAVTSVGLYKRENQAERQGVLLVQSNRAKNKHLI